MDFSILTNYRKGTKVFADYDVLHQCQNFDALVQYTKDHRWTKKYQSQLEGYEENQRKIHEQQSHGDGIITTPSTPLSPGNSPET